MNGKEKSRKENDKAEKADRLSEALRANLQRRKAQTRGRKSTDRDPEVESS